MKKWMLYCLILTISLVLAACGGNGGGNEEGQNGGDNMNVDQTGFDGDTDTDNMNNNNGNDNNGNNNNNGEDQYELAEKAADRISKEIKQVDNAYVLKTDNNAYVAVEVKQNDNGNNNGNNGNNGNNNTNGMNNNNEQDDQLTDNVKNKISKIVKSVDKDVENVYVSANPDFFNLADNYAQDAGNGEPIEGIFDQLGNMIERVFPDNPNE